jgi:hypothetical protein
MSAEARRLARNFSLSLNVPVYLLDERATTYEARRRMWNAGMDRKEVSKTLDSILFGFRNSSTRIFLQNYGFSLSHLNFSASSLLGLKSTPEKYSVFS